MTEETEENQEIENKTIIVSALTHKVLIDALNLRESFHEGVNEETGEKFIIHFKLKNS